MNKIARDYRIGQLVLACPDPTDFAIMQIQVSRAAVGTHVGQVQALYEHAERLLREKVVGL